MRVSGAASAASSASASASRQARSRVAEPLQARLRLLRPCQRASVSHWRRRPPTACLAARARPPTRHCAEAQARRAAYLHGAYLRQDQHRVEAGGAVEGAARHGRSSAQRAELRLAPRVAAECVTLSELSCAAGALLPTFGLSFVRASHHPRAGASTVGEPSSFPGTSSSCGLESELDVPSQRRLSRFEIRFDSAFMLTPAKLQSQRPRIFWSSR